MRLQYLDLYMVPTLSAFLEFPPWSKPGQGADMPRRTQHRQKVPWPHAGHLPQTNSEALLQ